MVVSVNKSMEKHSVSMILLFCARALSHKLCSMMQ